MGAAVIAALKGHRYVIMATSGSGPMGVPL